MGNSKINKMNGIHEQTGWRALTEGGFVYGAGNSEFFNTGDWRVRMPVWRKENCKQCLLCFPVCPDSSIPVEDGKRQDFDLFHCKGCGICANVCPFGAIAMRAAGKEDGNE